jgi:co-chaperonin GroES (HSP10)
MKFRPLHDRIVIKSIEAEAKTAGGIIIPDTAKEKPSKAKLLPLAPGDVMTPASSFRSTSRPATGCCSASGPAPRSRSMTRNT